MGGPDLLGGQRLLDPAGDQIALAGVVEQLPRPMRSWPSS
jgi:hypothetical protein